MAVFSGTALDMFRRRIPLFTSDQFEDDPVSALFTCLEACSSNPFHLDMYENNGTVDRGELAHTYAYAHTHTHNLCCFSL